MTALAPGPMHPLRSGRGFTLIELLVALFIAAIMFAMGYGAISQALHNRGSIREHQKSLLALQKAMFVMEQDFVQLAPRPIRSPEGQGWLPAISAQAANSDSTASDSSAGTDSIDSGPAPLVTLTRAGWSNPIGVQRPELERVAYVLDNGTLIREHWNVLDPTLSDPPVKRNLLKHLRSVRFRYLNFSRHWVTQWPPLSPGASQSDAYLRMRPLAVEVTLDSKDWGKIVRIFEIAG